MMILLDRRHLIMKKTYNTAMYKLLQSICVIIVIFYNCDGQLSPFDIKFYEYGEHVPGEQISYIYNGIVPGFKPIFILNVTPVKEDLEPVFTYLRVEYYNLMSNVDISYDQNSSALNFHVKFPFVDIPIGILGYSLPIQVNE